MIHKAEICIHPVVDVALEVEHDLFTLRLEFINQARSRLRNIEAVVLAGESIDVVKQGITVLHLHCLADTDTDDPGKVDTALLVKDDRLCGNGSRRKVALQTNEYVSETAIRSRYEDFLQYPFTGIHLRAHRIHAHPNDRIARQLSRNMHVPFDRAGALCNRIGRDQANTKE